MWMKSYGTLWCYHSNESYWAVLSRGAVYYVVQGGSNFGFTIQMKAAEQYFEGLNGVVAFTVNG